MTDKPEVTGPPANLDGDLDEDMWVRGKAYVRHKQLLEQAEVYLIELERKAARAEYEHAVTQRIRDKTADPEARSDWNVKAAVAQDFAAMVAQELQEASDEVAYYRAMVVEMEADLGEKAVPYETALAPLMWEEEEDWDEDDFDDFDPLEELGLEEGICPFVAVCPILNEEIGLVLDEEEDEEDAGETTAPEAA